MERETELTADNIRPSSTRQTTASPQLSFPEKPTPGRRCNPSPSRQNASASAAVSLSERFHSKNVCSFISYILRSCLPGGLPPGRDCR